MTKAQIQKMIDTKILILTNWETFWHYSIIPLLLVTPTLTTIDVFKYYVTHTYNSTKPIDFFFGYMWLLPTIIFYFIQRHRLKFKTIIISIDSKVFHEVVKQTAKELNWKIIQMTNDIAVAVSGFNWLSWGEQITIIREKDKLLFNSICDPDNRPSVASFGMNKYNRTTFEKLLRRIHNQ